MEAYRIRQAEELLRELAVIPAPTGQEGRRIAFCRDWLIEHGVTRSEVDAAGNLRIFFGNEAGPIDVFMAHADIVFPDTEELPLTEDEEWLSCPGIADNSAHAAAVMTYAAEVEDRLIKGAKIKDGGLLFVINVGEEGLGNLKGSKAVISEFGSRIRSFVTFDSVTNEVVAKAVGSVRWRVRLTTRGGHSFRDHGSPNAIECLSGLIEQLYARMAETAGSAKKTAGGSDAGDTAGDCAGISIAADNNRPVCTWNVGRIEGGTSVNTIAQEAVMLFECRSDSREALEAVKSVFNRVTAGFPAARCQEMSIETEILGERPCMAGVDPAAHEELIRTAEELIRRYYQEEPVRTLGSTDANAALAQGIPAVCFGLCRGEGAHTYGERLRKDSLLPGLKAGWEMILKRLN